MVFCTMLSHDLLFHVQEYILCTCWKISSFYAKFLEIFAAPQKFLDISETSEIGGGLLVQHGYNTIISPAKMGNNCWINQGVSIGHRTEVGQPEIGDNVRIAAGALVLGALKSGEGQLSLPVL